MTSRIIRNSADHPFPGGLKEIVIGCDHMSCDVSLNDSEIREGGGLRNMGWVTIPIEGKLRHYCPAHTRQNSTRSE